MSVKNIDLQNILHYCSLILHFSMLCICSFDGKGVVHSWHPSAMNGQIAKFNKIFFSQQLSMSYFRESWFQCREQSRVFKAIFVLCLYATHSFIFVNNVKMVPRGQPCPVSERNSVLCTYCGYSLFGVCTGAPRSSRLLFRNTFLSRYTRGD